MSLRVTPSGSRKYVQRIVICGKRGEIALGSADLVSLADARAAAAANRAIAGTGGDPINEKREVSTIPSFTEAARLAHPELAFTNPMNGKAFLTNLEA